MKKIYISGQITDNNNAEAIFTEAVEYLQKIGWKTVNPFDLNEPKRENETDEEHWNRCIITDLIALSKCDAIYMLKGWEMSHGANIEYHAATRTGKLIYYEYSKNVKLSNILIIINKYFEVDIRIKSKKTDVMIPRLLYYYISRKHTNKSFRSIGELINRNHASVLQGIKSLNNLIETNYKDIKNDIENSEKQLNYEL